MRSLWWLASKAIGEDGINCCPLKGRGQVVVQLYRKKGMNVRCRCMRRQAMAGSSSEDESSRKRGAVLNSSAALLVVCGIKPKSEMRSPRR